MKLLGSSTRKAKRLRQTSRFQRTSETALSKVSPAAEMNDAAVSYLKTRGDHRNSIDSNITLEQFLESPRPRLLSCFLPLVVTLRINTQMFFPLLSLRVISLRSASPRKYEAAGEAH